MLKSTTIHTAHGYAIRVRRMGLEIEMETSTATGDVISTVRMSEADAVALLDELDEEFGQLSTYSRGYDDGYTAGQGDAA